MTTLTKTLALGAFAASFAFGVLAPTPAHAQVIRHPLRHATRLDRHATRLDRRAALLDGRAARAYAHHHSRYAARLSHKAARLDRRAAYLGHY